MTTGPPPKFNGTRDNLPACRLTESGSRPEVVRFCAAFYAGRMPRGGAIALVTAFVPRGRLRRPGLILAGGVAGVAVAVLAAALATELIERLPSEAAAPASSRPPAPPDLQARPAVLVLLVLIALFYGVAAVGFFR